MKDLLRLYEERARELPDEVAVEYHRAPFAGVRLTWRSLWERSFELRDVLADAGGTQRALYALVLSEHPDLVPLLVAMWHLDSAAVLLDHQWGPRLTESVLAHSTPELRVIVADDIEVQRLDGGRPADDLSPDAAFLGYTSGSTGDPKAIVFTHERLVNGTRGNASASVRLRGERPRRLALSMRMSGSGVINLHYTWALVLGSTVVVLPELDVSTARDYWQRIDGHDIDQTFLVPQLVELVNHLAAERDRSRRGPLCFTGSAPLPPKTQERFHRRTGLPLYNAYGMSETMSAAFFGQPSGDGLATIKVGVPERAAARLRGLDGELVAGEGEGELELAGDQVFEGYFRNPEATASTLVDGWLRTGDVMRRDADGVYEIVGRAKDVVMKGSYAIYLTEVEEVANTYAEVREAAAVPVQLAASAEDIGLLVRLMPGAGLAADELLARLKADLGPMRAPCRVVLTDDPLPRGGQEKLVRPAIVDYWGSLSGVPKPLRRNWATTGG